MRSTEIDRVRRLAAGSLATALARPMLRRTLIGAGIAAAFTPFAPVVGRSEQAALYASSAQLEDGRYAVVFAAPTGEVVRTAIAPARGHCAAVDPSGRWCVTFARRPGTFALAMDRTGATADLVFATPEGRHFEGHGAFSPAGALLYAAENAYDEGTAVVGVYDATDGFRRIGELPGYGLGTHELILAPDGRHLILAHGGILTHPDYPRAELNLGEMEPSLVLLDRDTGDLVEKVAPPQDLRALSLRHLAVDGRGTTWIGCQWNGDDREPAPLIAVRSADGELVFLDIAVDDTVALDHYIGSVAVDRDRGLVAVTSPRGGMALIFDAQSRRIVDRRPLADGCGVAAAPEAGFVLTSGGGDVVEHLPDGERVHHTDIAWDNHLRRL